MGSIRHVVPVKLIIGSLTGIPELEKQVEQTLAKQFGPIDLASPVMAFNYTEYYTREMGSRLRRTFYSFERLIDPAELAGIKRRTNELEAAYAVAAFPVLRPINLDPGYLEMGKLILASTKNHSHRIYLQEGIYAEVTLLYREKQFQPLEWTYPDYRSPAYHTFFLQIRGRYRFQLMEAGFIAGKSKSP